MKSVRTHDLASHRAFFTEYDLHGDPKYWIVDSVKEAVSKDMERKLKLLLLTKSSVIVAASQLLESPFAHSIIIENPELIESGAIVSSLKFGHNSTREFLNIKRDEEIKSKNNTYHSAEAFDIANLIDDKGTSIRWHLAVMSDWFRDRLVKDLSDDSSLIRTFLRSKKIHFPLEIGNLLKYEKGLSRGRVEDIVKNYGNQKLTEFLKVYADFIYYLSGARATESEGVLPQENLVDISISEFMGHKMNLSENDIFFKVFIDTVKAKTSTIFPSDFLDILSIKDVLDLRSVAVSDEFVAKYNILQSKTKEAINITDSDRLVLHLSELEEFESKLFVNFNESLNTELGKKLTRIRQNSAVKTLHSVSSIAGFGIDAYKDLVVSGLKWMSFDKIADKIDKKVEIGLKTCSQLLYKMNLLDRQLFLDYVDTLKNKYKEKL